MKIATIPNVQLLVPPINTPAIKSSGFARFVFVSRICKMKNLIFALKAIRGIQGAVLDIYGPNEDSHYWMECQSYILNNSIPANYHGEIAHGQVLKTLQKGHFFILPTLGENFGHAIFEALASGCPPLISNKTSWSDLLEKEAGWAVPLEYPEIWRRIICRCVAMGSEEYSEISNASHRYAHNWLPMDTSEKYAEMFRHAKENGQNQNSSQ